MITFHHNKNLEDKSDEAQSKQQKCAKNHLNHKWEEAIMQI